MGNDNTHQQAIKPAALLDDSSSTGKKRPWKRHKVTSRAIAASLRRISNAKKGKRPELSRRAARMKRCGDYLVFADTVNTETGEVTRKLRAAEFCRDRLCPMCQWRKSLVTFHQLSEIMDRVAGEHPDAVPLFLTLTVRNCASETLGETIALLLKSWSRMMNKAGRRKPWRVALGWFRALEITYNQETGEWHPHIHAIVLVRESYFDTAGTDYIDHDGWVAEWRWALRADYDPSVEVHTVKGERAHAVAEVSKYAVKPGEWVDEADSSGTDERVELLATVLKGCRLVAFGGVMKEARAALKQEDAETADLVQTGDDATVRGDLVVALDRFEWQIGVTNYVQVSHEEVDVSAAANDAYGRLFLRL